MVGKEIVTEKKRKADRAKIQPNTQQEGFGKDRPRGSSKPNKVSTTPNQGPAGSNPMSDKEKAAILDSEGRRQKSQLAGSDTRDAFTKKMEKLLGLNRSSAQIDKDVAATKELDKDLLYRGGKVKSRSKVSRGNTSASKKYTMNRGGKVASVRKPTRA